MIRYDLKCDQGHVFDSWFSSSSGYDDQRANGQVSCPTCGSGNVEKTLMAPQCSSGGGGDDPTPQEAIAKLRAYVEQTSEHVGTDFAKEARAIHLGDAPQRQIHGQASADEARGLLEDGVPVLPLPFTPRQKLT